jgi:hypothetical protein
MALFSPPFHFNEVPLSVVQRRLCHSFRRWGLPRVIQVDNGKPFGDPQRASVPELALWLIGLGIKVVWSRIRTPKDNATVERMQRTTACWSEPQQCHSLEELQLKLNQIGSIQRDRYTLKRRRGKTRGELYAALGRNRRRYCSNRSFDVKKVYTYLQKLVFVRRVSKGGCFTFYAQSVYVGTRYKNQDLLIKFNGRKGCWQLTTPEGKPLGHFSADNFSPTALKKLNVCRQRNLKVVQVHDAEK